ncbi:hypothetical protein [Bradyrhizobium sp. Ec3.3]|uniref:hypothetical protein n=1 Tax=Bradyrhizobium sp. Ec3.3 TaxID=189753 RepID=UPI000481B627|nr:hypothetical protein [Bradyrhizobium sp. Ec3.3]
MWCDFRSGDAKLDTRSPSNSEADPWAGWNTWAESKIANALAKERAVVLEAIAEEINNAVTEAHDHLAGEVKSLRIECTQLQETITELRSIIKSEKAKVIDLPNLLRKAN